MNNVINLVTAIKPNHRNIVSNINVLATCDKLIISGRSIDDYEDTYILNRHNKDEIDSFFEYVYIGNHIASVKYKVVDIVWSSEARNIFLLVCQNDEYHPDMLLSNNVILLVPSQNGFIETSMKEFNKSIFD